MAKRNPHPASIRSTKTATIKDVVDAMLKSYNLNKRFDQTHVVASWEKTMGKAIAKRTTHLEIRNNVLVVTLNSAPLKQELNASRQKALDLIHKEFGGSVIKDILFI
ncbi:MAG: DUF721 domain-containing protein [Reichenbachiella sp.]